MEYEIIVKTGSYRLYVSAAGNTGKWYLKPGRYKLVHPEKLLTKMKKYSGKIDKALSAEAVVQHNSTTKKGENNAADKITHAAGSGSLTDPLPAEPFLQKLFNFIDTGVYITDEQGVIADANEACCTMFGYSRKELIGKNYSVLLPGTTQPGSGTAAVMAIQEAVHKKGSVIYITTTTKHFIHADGKNYKITSVANITAQEKALAIPEQLYRSLFNNNPMPLYIFDFFTHRIIEVNDAALQKYGYTREDFLSLDLKDLHLPSEQPKKNKILKDGAGLEKGSNGIKVHKKKSGELIYMRTTCNIINYKGRKCVLCLLNDVTEKVKAESQKEFERRDKEALINTTEDQIWSVSKDLKFIAGNNAFITAVKSATGKTIKPGDYLLTKESYSTDLLLFWHEMYYRALSGDSFRREIVTREPFTDKQRWREVSFKPISNGKEISGIACYSRDITENKLYQNQLVTINKKLETAQQIAGLGYWEIDPGTNTVFFSDELYHIYGFSNTGKRIPLEQVTAAVHPDDKEAAAKQYAATIHKKQPYNCEHRIILKDGTIKVLIQKGNLVYNEQGVAVAFEGTSQDITFRKKAEKAVKESEEKYRMIFNSNPLPNWIYHLETLKILEVNNAAITHYGYSKEEFLNMSVKDIFLLEAIEDLVKINKNIRSYGLLDFGQWQHIKKSGKKINVAITGHTIQYNNKNAVMIAANNITEIVQTQQALAKSIERFEYATKATSDAIWDYDLINNTIYWGEGFNTLFGYKMRERKPGINAWEAFIHPTDSEKILQSIYQVINNPDETHWKGEYRFKKFDGTYTMVADSALVVRDAKGNPYRIIGAMQDITERIQKEVVLKELNSTLNKRAAELAASNAELEQFAYIASHDLQEPLRMVTGFLTQIQKKYEPQLDETGQVYIKFAVDGAIRMRRIILDLLEYSRVGRQQYHIEKINTQELLKEACRMYTGIAKVKKIIINYEGLPDIVAAKIPVQQVFQNLISNAVKYQQPGNIPEIKISAADNEDHWQFAVEDNGIGIDTAYLDTVFVIFKRLHSKDEYSGTGIGLAICKKIIDNHQGKIWVESAPGKGSTFYFTISKLLPAS
jgi:PAS domain S-box-containing protein